MHALLLISAMFAGAEPSGPRLAVIRAAPDFELRDADDKKITLHQFRGQAVLVSFFFTTCNGTCPATTARLAKVQEEIAKRADLKGRVRIATISMDPLRDTPEKLRGYARLYDVDLRSWSFVTGSVGAIRRTLDAWGVWAKPAANGQLDHPSRVYLVDPQGRIREIYNLEFLRPTWVVEDIASLLKEDHP